MTAPVTNTQSVARHRALQIAIVWGLAVFALALCALVVVMMLRRGPAVAY